MPPDTLTPQDALASISRATSFTEPVRRRSEGVTIALWGFVTAAILLTSGVLNDLHGFMHAGGWRQWVALFSWVPWAGLGVLGTLAIWRIAEAPVRDPDPGLRRSRKLLLLWAALLLAIALLMGFAVPVAQAGTAIAIMGVLWVTIGALGPYRLTRAGRRSVIIIAVVVILAGLIHGLLTAGDEEAGWRAYTAVGTLAGGLVPIVVGLVQALRG